MWKLQLWMGQRSHFDFAGGRVDMAGCCGLFCFLGWVVKGLSGGFLSLARRNGEDVMSVVVE